MAVLYYRKNTKWLKRLTLALIVIFLATASNFIPNLMINGLEQQYQPLVSLSDLDRNRPTDVLVLGSGHTADPDLPPLAQLSSTALQRLTEGIRIFDQIPEARLIVSGYGDDSARSQAEVLQDAAISLGVPEARIARQSEPTTTEEEAKAYKSTFGTDRQLILVTSAAHMPRAIYLFRKTGSDPIPAPTGYEVLNDPTEPFDWDFFSTRNFRKVEAALHEYIGMLWAKLR